LKHFHEITRQGFYETRGKYQAYAHDRCEKFRCSSTFQIRENDAPNHPQWQTIDKHENNIIRSRDERKPQKCKPSNGNQYQQFESASVRSKFRDKLNTIKLTQHITKYLRDYEPHFIVYPQNW